ncbi:MAG TPA: hypothetical protein VKQ28_07470 [Candidatus Acidoferrum sp.]|nr:hypothetical protein [Candidatus Acidoferrum sp.]
MNFLLIGAKKKEGVAEEGAWRQVFPLFTQLDASSGFGYTTANTTVAELSTNSQRSSQQQGDFQP